MVRLFPWGQSLPCHAVCRLTLCPVLGGDIPYVNLGFDPILLAGATLYIIGIIVHHRKETYEHESFYRCNAAQQTDSSILPANGSVDETSHKASIAQTEPQMFGAESVNHPRKEMRHQQRSAYFGRSCFGRRIALSGRVLFLAYAMSRSWKNGQDKNFSLA